ncbi:MAG: DEAD/DEAH box helicase [Gammaproteobacteria bacterium]|nr:MAG: DEAD/DEAH box helicase [Gammaproteobacteria bacterium]TLY80314.1 MAG: DEAD/DEAH box helicase [Gammaproteobacteria bacterium]
MTDPHSGSPTFQSLGLAPALMAGIREAGFTHCTPIQAQTLPIALAGRDVAGQAQTGTGKTAAFLVALYHALLTRPAPASRGPTSIRALVVAPTRELAVQIHHDAEILGRHTGFKHAVVYGGIDYEKQRRQLEEGVDVLIGTPGRLIDYLKQRVYDMRHAQVLVLDEADRMFDLGFIADIRYILRRLPHPERRQSMLFSATLSYRVLELAYEHMNNPELVRIEPDKVTVDQVRQMMYYPSMQEKVPLLIGLLRQAEARRTLIFVNTKRMAERLESILKANGFHAQALSGDVPQNKRLRFLRDFHNGDLAVLIATDVASRGLHIPDVSHVFNFDLPQDAPDYVHRIGRTARAGAEGDAISFACEDFAVALPEIESYIGHKIPATPITPDLLATSVAEGQHSRRPRPPLHGGRRPSHGQGARPGRKGPHSRRDGHGRGR